MPPKKRVDVRYINVELTSEEMDTLVELAAEAGVYTRDYVAGLVRKGMP